MKLALIQKFSSDIVDTFDSGGYGGEGYQFAAWMSREAERVALKAREQADWTPDSIREAVAERMRIFKDGVTNDTVINEVSFDVKHYKDAGAPQAILDFMTEANQHNASRKVQQAQEAMAKDATVEQRGLDDAPSQVEDVLEEVKTGNYDRARTAGLEGRAVSAENVQKLGKGEPYGTWDMLDYFAGTKKSEVKPDGVYSQFTHMDTGKVYSETRDAWQTARYETDKRLVGVTIQELQNGKTDEGMELEASTDRIFLDPTKTPYLIRQGDPKLFDQDLQALIEAGKKGTPDADIIANTEFGKIYTAYVGAVGATQAPSFEVFILAQLKGPMVVVYPPTAKQLRELEDAFK
jgi:hypothetical protein